MKNELENKIRKDIQKAIDNALIAEGMGTYVEEVRHAKKSLLLDFVERTQGKLIFGYNLDKGESIIEAYLNKEL